MANGFRDFVFIDPGSQICVVTNGIENRIALDIYSSQEIFRQYVPNWIKFCHFFFFKSIKPFLTKSESLIVLGCTRKGFGNNISAFECVEMK